MAEVTYLEEDKRRKYKVRKKYALEYDCKCGTHVVLETDVKPEKLTKCFKCQNEVK